LFHKYAENTFKYRDRLYITADILKATKRGTTKTEIMYKAGLSFAQLSGYLSFAVRLGLVEVASKNGRLFYKTTAKGMRYFKSYAEIRHLLQEKPEHTFTSVSSPVSYP
jgi:predicted transcriptional regulator